MMRTRLTHARRLALSTASATVAILLWQILSGTMTHAALLPPPAAVAAAFVRMLASGDLWIAVRDSLSRIAVGYAAGAACGVVSGLALGRVRALGASFGVLFDFLKGIPPIALVPLVIIWFGIGETSKYIVIAYIVWVVVAINTAVGAREVPRVRLRAGAVLGASAVQSFWLIVLPSCLIYIVSGMRSAIGFAFVALVSAELIGARTGIGQIIMDARFSLQTARMIVGLLLLGLIGSLLQISFDALVGRLRPAERFQ